jgi:exodeoxyribonuclease VII small subunit
MNKKLTYDAAFAELNDILTSIQSDETGLDQLSEKLKRAAELTEFCKAKLRAIELDIEKINPAE